MMISPLSQPGPSSPLYTPAASIKGKGKERASSNYLASSPLEEPGWPPARESERWTTSELWKRSRARAKSDKTSWDYVLTSGVAGGIAGCVAKTAIAPLDRVKILFQTSNADFRKYAGTPLGLIHATGTIYKTSGIRGLFQGHSATLMRIFPYAGIKYMLYDWMERILIPTPDHRSPWRFFVAGATSGVTSVLFTYPLELVRVRLAYQTKVSERTSLLEAVKSIYHENNTIISQSRKSSISPFIRSIPLYPFYRGFSITILGMIPYAGVSFLTYGTLKKHAPEYIPYLRDRPTMRDLSCGAVAGAVSQTASYPFEVIRRRMQVGGTLGNGGINPKEAIQSIYAAKGWRGFFVGLSIGYIKVIPMTR
uniref:Solute carrier family 25 (Mitochondrial carrier protein), member 16 n=1 Tax=Kwoniella bestiolae CBS 10118 TaxID=1296100 RepID=A0A1B9G8J6_9TREE|nr:solute carrier family 25 (mitochondrial carrier protein), member 16 [Kwoniella bestiolae CBS 10118]OCF27342.1 solute carrier family 25 (mitochondrial carrier protein), member 16 [Kwoniella bestiolae CBS 10118]